MDDTAKKLRNLAKSMEFGGWPTGKLAAEAADHIDALAAQLAEANVANGRMRADILEVKEKLAAAERERDKSIVKADTLQFLVNQRDIDIHALRARLAEAEANLAEIPTLCRRYEARLAEAEREREVWRALMVVARNRLAREQRNTPTETAAAIGREIAAIDAALERTP